MGDGEFRMKRGSPNTEEYTVRKAWVNKVLSVLGVMPDRDAFATVENARFPKWYTASDDALLQEWDPTEILWCNPPWTLWPRVASKILAGRNTCVCIIPTWHSKQWVHDLVNAASKIFYIEPGCKVFELRKRPVEGLKWGLFALLVQPGGG